MKRIISILVALVVVGGFGGTLFYLWKKAQRQPVVYDTKKPFVTDIVKKTVATGSIVPRKEVEIKPQVSGIIQALHVEPGDRVKQGDIVATIRVIPSMQGLSAAEARLSKAKVELTNAEREHDRIRKTFDEGIAPEADWRRAEIERDRAREEVQAATDNLDVIRRGSTRYAGDTGNTLVRSTITGTVLEVPIEEGNSVIEANTFNAGTTIATVADMSELIFLGKVDESEVGKLRPGMDLELTIGAVETKKLKATLERIAPKGKEENGAIQFEIRAALIPDPETTVRANYSANADIVLDKRAQVLALDEGLLKFEGENAFVEVMTAPQVFEKRQVKTGLSDGLAIEILDGLKAEDQVKAGVLSANANGAPKRG